MKKAASIFLRSELTKQDVLCISRWMQNTDVTRFPNEHASISGALQTLAETTPEPMLAMRFNRDARFYIVSLCSGKPIGYVSLRPTHLLSTWSVRRRDCAPDCAACRCCFSSGGVNITRKRVKQTETGEFAI